MEHSYRLLAVDDEPDILRTNRRYLEARGYQVDTAVCAADALKRLGRQGYDCILLDVLLPDMNGYKLCEAVRSLTSAPILFLSCMDDEADKIKGLMAGGDDYITKPFTPLEVVARVKAQLRRFTQYNKGTSEENVLTIRGLLLNRDTHECLLNEEPVDLTPTEFAILWTLAENQGKVITSEELFSTVWQEKYFENSNNTVMVHVRHLRQKLKDSAERPKYIKTIWGVGYKIEK